jgi:hypothetical protein
MDHKIINGIKINYFDLNLIPINPKIYIIGKRGRGKSWICRHLIRFFNFDHTNIVAPTEIYNKDFYNLEKKCKVFFKIDDQPNEYNNLLVLDDAVYSKIQYKFLEYIIEKNQSLICTMQYPTINDKNIHHHYDYIFLAIDYYMGTVEKIYDYFVKEFIPNIELFNNIFKECTNDFNFLVIDNKNKSLNIEDRIFIFKASENVINIRNNKIIDILENIFNIKINLIDEAEIII